MRHGSGIKRPRLISGCTSCVNSGTTYFSEASVSSQREAKRDKTLCKVLTTPRHVQQRFGLVITLPLDLTLWSGMMTLHLLEFTTRHCASQVKLIYSCSETERGPCWQFQQGKAYFWLAFGIILKPRGLTLVGIACVAPGPQHTRSAYSAGTPWSGHRCPR